MSVFDSVRRQFTPVHPEGYVFIAAFFAATLALAWLWAPLGWIGAIATAWCVYFFRDPSRVTPLRAINRFNGTSPGMMTSAPVSLMTRRAAY